MRGGGRARGPPGGLPRVQRLRPELRHHREQHAWARHRAGGLCVLHLGHGDGALSEGDDGGLRGPLPAGGRPRQVRKGHKEGHGKVIGSSLTGQRGVRERVEGIDEKVFFLLYLKLHQHSTIANFPVL